MLDGVDSPTRANYSNKQDVSRSVSTLSLIQHHHRGTTLLSCTPRNKPTRNYCATIQDHLREQRLRYDDDDDRVWNCGAWFEYILVVVVSSILLIAASVLTIFWTIYYRKGFNMDDPKLQFNLHPVLMIGGYVTLSGFSILLYRICRCCSHLIVKLCHTFFHACSIPCIVIGFMAVWDSHNQQQIPNFYSLHSWLGMITMGLFALQFVLGFFSFLILLCCENATYKFRSTMVPIHASFGVATFMLAIATAVTGLTQKAHFELGENYSQTIEEGIIMNSIGVILAGLGIIIPFAVRRSNSPANCKVYVTERI
uniref:Cytochrome b561 domain-containing protein n=1 Tax=Anopheles culicifacies TaxID=139723 RepID=A0A182MFN3_9DIPT